MKTGVSISASLLKLANRLEGDADHASQRRAVSSAYYAVFHAFADALTSTILGYRKPSPTDHLATEWTRVYRSVDHGALKNALQRFAKLPLGGTPVAFETDDLSGISVAFVTLQESRHTADYDPFFDPVSANITRASLGAANLITWVIENDLDRTILRALAIEVLIKSNPNRK